MKKRTRAALALALVVLQLFCIFIPVSAADATEGEGSWVEKSFNETTIVQDLGANALEKYPLVESSDKTAAEIIAAITRAGQDRSNKGVALYLYIYVPSGTEDFKAGTVKLSKADYTLPLVSSMNKIDMTATILKVRIDLTESDYNDYLTAGKDRFQIYLESFQLKWHISGSIQTVSYDAVSRALSGGKLTSGILLTVSLDGEPIEWYVAETLKLDVHLSAERYSTPDNNVFKQLNTAVFLVPKTYFYDESEKYLNLSKIIYQYELYEDVPFFVTDDPSFIEQKKTNWDIEYFGVYDIMDFVPYLKVPYKSPNPNFAFYTSSIGTVAGSSFDFSSQQFLSDFADMKASFEEFTESHPMLSILNFDTYIGAGRYTPLKIYERSSTLEIKTESYANGASFWQKLFDNRLFGTNHDDSVQVKAIQVVSESTLKGKLDSDLKATYALSDEGLLQLRRMLDGTQDEYVAVVFHFLETNYEAYTVSGYSTYDRDIYILGGTRPYIAYNAIIDQFRILELYYENENIVKSVPVVMPTMTFVAELESPDKLEDETYDPPVIKLPDLGAWWRNAKDKIQDLLEKIQQILYIILIVVIVGVCIWGGTKVVKFIGAARDAFGRRGGGKGGGGSG